MTLIIGIDPGLQKTGWGIIKQEGNHIAFVACGVVKAAETSLPLSARLLCLSTGLCAILTRYHLDEAAVEETFVNVNGQSTLKLGQARGAILLTLAQAEIAISEYAATLVKKSIVGAGRAEKNQVAHMVQLLLPGCGKHGADAMDALAIALCHANHRKYTSFL